MRSYFEKMDDLGKPLKPAQMEKMAENRAQIEAVMKEVEAEVERVKKAGLPADKIRQRGEMTIWDRIEYLVDPGHFLSPAYLIQPQG